MDKATCRERDLQILKMLSRGKTPKTVISWVCDTYGMTPQSSYNVVYGLNRTLNKSIKEICAESADYIANTIIGVIEDDECDNKTKLQALKQLADLTGAEKPKENNISVNFGFNYE